MTPSLSSSHVNAAPALLRAAALASVSLAALAFSAGCERATGTDLRVSHEKGARYIQGGESDKAADALKEFAQGDGAPGATLQHKFTLGHAQMDQAYSKVAQLEAVYLDISRLQGEIGQIASTLSVGNTLVAGYRMNNPSATRQIIRQRIAEAQGGPDKAVWIDTGKMPIPTQVAAKQKVSEFEGKVTAKKEQIDKLTNDRAAALTESDRLREAVDTLKGRAAVDAYAKASESRKKVSLISGDIDSAQGELAHLESDLGVAKGLLVVVESHIAGLQAQDRALATGFEAVSEKVSGQLEVSKRAVAGAGDAASASITGKADELAAKLDEASKLFTEAEASFKAAVTAYESAYNEANSFRQDIGTKLDLYRGKNEFEESQLSVLQRSVWPSLYRIQQGVSLSAVGDLHARRAAVLGAHDRLVGSLTAVLKAAGLEVPAKLKTDEPAVAAARKAADEAFAASVNELDGAASTIQGQDPEKRRQASIISRVFVNYAWSQLKADAGDAAGAKEKLDEAIRLRDSVAAEADGKFPAPLPSALALQPAATPPAAPATP